MGHVVQEWADAPGVLSAGRLDLDDIGPQVGHHLAAPLALLVGQFEDSEPGQGP